MMTIGCVFSLVLSLRSKGGPCALCGLCGSCGYVGGLAGYACAVFACQNGCFTRMQQLPNCISISNLSAVTKILFRQDKLACLPSQDFFAQS